MVADTGVDQMSIKVLIADDERLVRTGLRMILAAEPGIAVIGEAADGHQAVAETHRLQPDVVLMDVRMPRLDGLEATRRLLVPGASALHVIVLTTYDLDDYVYEALRIGASAFLLKDAPEDQLVAAIHVVADGGSIFAPSATRHLVEAFAVDRQPPPQGLAELTVREREVLRLLARGRSNRDIADALGVSQHTARTHVAHVLDKLGLHDRVQAVVLAYEVGIVRPGRS
jgi:DNA-binding NarL/FixJ family response regulator